jgi:hypothetical protein
VWNKSGDSAFEKHTPLAFNANRNRRLGSKVDFDVLFLEGLNLLSEGYREGLSRLGYHLHDMESLYRRLSDGYQPLAQFGDYEQKCFIRWLVIQHFCGNEPFVHYDADIVFNATPEEIEADFSGLTFILQGCPAYTRVDDPRWLEIYRVELDRLAADVEAYSGDAWRERPVFASTFKERNGALWNRRLLSSDQDLLQFLTLSGRLPQADAVTVGGRCSTALFQNPLVIGSDIRSSLPLPLRYERRDGIDYICSRKVAFWHMQSNFCDYLGYATFRRSLGDHGRIPWVPSEQPLSYLWYRAIKRFSSAYGRGQLMRRYFGDCSDDLGFLLNNKTFWQDGIFA